MWIKWVMNFALFFVQLCNKRFNKIVMYDYGIFEKLTFVSSGINRTQSRILSMKLLDPPAFPDHLISIPWYQAQGSWTADDAASSKQPSCNKISRKIATNFKENKFSRKTCSKFQGKQWKGNRPRKNYDLCLVFFCTSEGERS